MRKKDDPVQNDVQKAHVFVDNRSSKSCFKRSPCTRRSCRTWWANNKQGTDVKRALSILIGLSQWLSRDVTNHSFIAFILGTDRDVNLKTTVFSDQKMKHLLSSLAPTGRSRDIHSNQNKPGRWLFKK